MRRRVMDSVLISSKNMNWQTPEWYLERVRALSLIGLDPCTTAQNPTSAGRYFYPEKYNGLDEVWGGYGLVFVNPPYGRDLIKWAKKIVEETTYPTEMVVLVPARTDARWYDMLLRESDAALHHKNRIKFIDPATGEVHKIKNKKGKWVETAAAFPSTTFYFGPTPGAFKRAFSGLGTFVRADFVGGA